VFLLPTGHYVIMKGFGFKSLLVSIRRDGFLGILNILGLSIGIAMSVLVFWYIGHNVSFDTHHSDIENIYRLVSKDINDGNLSFGNPLPMADAVRSDYPEEGIVAGISLPFSYHVIVNQTELEVKASVADAEIFKILDYRLQAGSSESVLREPNNAIVTNSCAEKLFGTDNPIGQVFSLKSFEGEILFSVKGVMNDHPGNSEFKPEILLSWQSMYPSDWREKWWWGGTCIFIKAVNAKQKDNLEQKINTILERHNAPFIQRRYEYQLLPLKGSHFRTDIDNAFSPAISSRLLWTLRIVALFIITIASINFINLASSQSEKNAKETGIRKVAGASQSNLIRVFLTTTLQKAFIAMFPAIVFVIFLSGPFRNLAQIDSTSPFNDPMIWILIVIMLLITGLLSGIYPAISLANSKPVAVLYNKRKEVTSLGYFRKILIVIQLVIANLLIISSLLIFKQISFMKRHDLGFNAKGLVALELGDLDSDWERKIQKVKVLEQEIIKKSVSAGILDLCETEAIPGSGIRNKFTVFETENWITFSVISIGVDENYSSLFNIPIVEGKNFGDDIASEKEAILINETFMRLLGWNTIENRQLALFNKENTIHVIGVFKDVHVSSLSQAIPPMIYRYKENSYPDYMVFRINDEKKQVALALIQNEWQKIAGEEPCKTFSVADSFRGMYGGEERLSTITGAFCLIAILLSCFGILAHVTYSIQRRTKEISIRKVFGAKTIQVITLLYTEIVHWCVVSFFIAFPVSYFIMSKWLENFAYKTIFSWWVFVLSFILTFGIAFLITILQTWRTARRNPVETLHYE